VGDFVHESVRVSGSLAHLQANLLHFTCDSLTEHMKSMDRYTTLAAEQIIAQNRRVTWQNLVVDPSWTFFSTYFLKRGFLDGFEGMAIAHMVAMYNFLKYAKARSMGARK